ncbi:MAG: hypothetical protein PVH83_07195, partial [Methyloceanibacter sp.]
PPETRKAHSGGEADARLRGTGVLALEKLSASAVVKTDFFNNIGTKPTLLPRVRMSALGCKTDMFN